MKVLVLQTSISDHYKLIGTVLRQTFAKGKPKTFFYSCYQNLDKVQFEDTLKQELLLAINFDLFYATFKSIRDKFYNSQPLWQNLFEKALMIRSTLENNIATTEASNNYKQASTQVLR